jgi:hypothetical protein
MATSRFHLLLTTSLAASLGAVSTLAFTVGDVSAYPGPGAVSAGTNPIVSGGTNITVPYYGADSTTLVSAPADQDVVITDLVLQTGTNRMSCLEQWSVEVWAGSAKLAQFRVITPMYSSYSYVTNTHHAAQVSLTSGLRIPAGEDALLITTRDSSDGSSCYDTRVGTLAVTWSGYQSQP